MSHGLRYSNIFWERRWYRNSQPAARGTDLRSARANIYFINSTELQAFYEQYSPIDAGLCHIVRHSPLDSSMNSIATRSQLIKTSLGAGIRDYELDRSSAPVVEDPFIDRMLQVNDSALASYSQASQSSSLHIRYNTNAIDLKATTPPTPTPTVTKPAYDHCIPLNDPIDRAACPPTSAVPTHPSSCDPPNDRPYTRASVQGWLQGNIQSTSTLTTTKTLREQGIQGNASEVLH